MPSSYDVIIIGSGPAGIFAALELVKNSHLKILLIEKGSDIQDRSCPTIESDVPCGHAVSAASCADGEERARTVTEITLTSEFGGRLKEYLL